LFPDHLRIISTFPYTNFKIHSIYTDPRVLPGVVEYALARGHVRLGKRKHEDMLEKNSLFDFGLMTQIKREADRGGDVYLKAYRETQLKYHKELWKTWLQKASIVRELLQSPYQLDMKEKVKLAAKWAH
jgi:hypothetical protein